MSRQYQWRDPTGLGRFTVVSLAAVVATRAVHGLLLIVMMAFMQPAIAASPQLLPRLVASETIINAFQNLALVVAVVACALWAFRASVNAHARARYMAHGPWATIFWYIVPFASLVMPCVVLMEIW